MATTLSRSKTEGAATSATPKSYWQGWRKPSKTEDHNEAGANNASLTYERKAKMKTEVKVLQCDCATNCDLDGAWWAEDVKQELDELDMPDAEWMSYILGHLFSDYEEWTSELENVVTSDAVREITLVFGLDKVRIRKR